MIIGARGGLPVYRYLFAVNRRQVALTVVPAIPARGILYHMRRATFASLAITARDKSERLRAATAFDPGLRRERTNAFPPSPPSTLDS